MSERDTPNNFDGDTFWQEVAESAGYAASSPASKSSVNDDALTTRLFEEAEAEVSQLVNDAGKGDPQQTAFALGVLSGQAKLWLYELKLAHARAGKTYKTGFI